MAHQHILSHSFIQCYSRYGRFT